MTYLLNVDNNKRVINAICAFLESEDFEKDSNLKNINDKKVESLSVDIGRTKNKKGSFAWYSNHTESNGTNIRSFADFIEWYEGKKPMQIHSVKLNDEYTAEIDEEFVTVGCQKFPHSVVLEVVKAIAKFKK